MGRSGRRGGERGRGGWVVVLVQGGEWLEKGRESRHKREDTQKVCQQRDRGGNKKHYYLGETRNM